MDQLPCLSGLSARRCCLIAVQANGYGEIAESALNAQDIAGPDFAPAFSLSQADARILKRSLRNKISACEDNTTDSEDTHNTLEQDAALLRRSSLKVSLDARSRVIPDTTAGNITGKIQGTETDSMILLSAHYDSYFDGFQDDNAAVAMMLGIARSLVKGGYKLPTLSFSVQWLPRNGESLIPNTTGLQEPTIRYSAYILTGRVK